MGSALGIELMIAVSFMPQDNTFFVSMFPSGFFLCQFCVLAVLASEHVQFDFKGQSMACLRGSSDNMGKYSSLIPLLTSQPQRMASQSQN